MSLLTAAASDFPRPSLLCDTQVEGYKEKKSELCNLWMQQHPEAAQSGFLCSALLAETEGGRVRYLGQDDAIGQARMSQA